MLLVFCLAALATSVPPSDSDIVVYGGTSAGVIAAVQAGRMGKSVTLIEPGRHVGGMTSGGLGSTDTGDVNLIGGLTREFYSEAYGHYHPTSSQAPDPALQWQFEPHVAEGIFTEMLRSAHVLTALNQRLDRVDGVRKENGRIRSITMEDGRTFRGKIFIDATYEGDLLAAAGVSYRLGRENVAEYREPLNGVYPERVQPIGIDPFRTPGDVRSGLLPGVESEQVGPAGSGDRRVQRYGLRLCLTDDGSRRAPLVQPADYNPLRYELLARYFHQHPGLTLRDVVKLEPIPNRKVDLNSNGFFSSDMPGVESMAWAESSYAERERIYRHYLSYSQGLLWFLAHDPRVPAAVREQMLRWGPAADEFPDNQHWPLMVYVREARRLRGAYTVTQHDCERAVTPDDPIAVGSYGMDSHTVTMYADAGGALRVEGFFFGAASDYPISYRAITPLPTECTNLLVPVCASATHVAFDSIRIEPTFMMLGQAAGTAAGLAIDSGSSVQSLDYAQLQARLLADGQIIRPQATLAQQNSR